jgi:hypothetical protein
MSVDNNTLNVIQLCVVLKSLNVNISFITKLSNLRTIIVAEHYVHLNCINNIKKSDKVDFQDLV